MLVNSHQEMSILFCTIVNVTCGASRGVIQESGRFPLVGIIYFCKTPEYLWGLENVTGASIEIFFSVLLALVAVIYRATTS